MGKVAEKLGTQSTWAPERLTSSDHFEISDRPKAASSSGFMLRSSRPCAPSLATTSLLAMAWAAASRKRARTGAGVAAGAELLNPATTDGKAACRERGGPYR